MKHTAVIGTNVKANPGVLSKVFLNEATQAYSAQSTSELAQSFLDLEACEAIDIVGVILGPILWIFLKSCPEKTKKEILEFLSPFRSGFKSVALLQNTGAKSGLQALRSPTAIIVGGVIGAGAGLLLTKYIQEKIKTSENGFNQNIKLNQLLSKHLAMRADLRIPSGFDDDRLIQWLENPNYSSELELVSINEHHFKTINEEELNRYYWFVLFNEIVNGAYADSVANTDFALMGLGAAMANYTGLALNTILLSGLIYTYFKIAQYKVDGFALNIRLSYLKTRTSLKERETKTEENSEKIAVTPSRRSGRQTKKYYDEWVEAKCEQRRCEEALVEYRKNKPRKIYLLNAGLKGFQVGGIMTQATMGSLFGILALAHVVSLACPPVFITLLVTTIAVGSVCSYLSYEQRKKELDAEDAKEAQSLPAEQPAAVKQSTTASTEIELKTFSASSEIEQDELDQPVKQEPTIQSSKTDNFKPWLGSFFSSKPTAKPCGPEKEGIELNYYNCNCAAAAA